MYECAGNYYFYFLRLKLQPAYLFRAQETICLLFKFVRQTEKL